MAYRFVIGSPLVKFSIIFIEFFLTKGVPKFSQEVIMIWYVAFFLYYLQNINNPKLLAAMLNFYLVGNTLLQILLEFWDTLNYITLYTALSSVFLWKNRTKWAKFLATTSKQYNYIEYWFWDMLNGKLIIPELAVIQFNWKHFKKYAKRDSKRMYIRQIMYKTI